MGRPCQWPEMIFNEAALAIFRRGSFARASKVNDSTNGKYYQLAAHVIASRIMAAASE